MEEYFHDEIIEIFISLFMHVVSFITGKLGVSIISTLSYIQIASNVA